jgi:diguanylate cyclase (GGDEF)-like protein/PAS domain S-box-containing protein
MPPELHPLLARQLRKLGLAPEQSPPTPEFALLLSHVSRAYADFDQERYLRDRSENIASAEMVDLNRALQASRARLGSLLSLSSDWIWEQDAEGRFTFVSEELEARTGLDRQALLGRACSADGALKTALDDLARMRDCVCGHERFHHVTFEVVSARGQCHHMRITGEPVFDGSRFVGYRGVGSDVTAAVLATRKIQQLACYDSLTGLPNRHLFMEELNHMLARSLRYGRRFALLFIDLDRFKLVNDNLGHAVGDAMLQTVGNRLGRLLRDADLLARLSGDEFVVVTEADCEVASLAKVASRILATITEPMLIDSRRLETSASIGIGICPTDGADAASLLRAADAAMYQAKSRGRNKFEFFTAELAQRAALHFALEGELRLAVKRRQLELHYQPKVDARTGRLVGAEALVRWNHPARGHLSPAAFIEMAEESGLIVPIGRWVLDAACAQMARWQNAGLAPPRCAVNISVQQIASGSLIADVRSALEQSGLDAQQLEIEVTESMLMADPLQAASVLEELDRLGVHIAIDDFGTGHSSLAYLKRFPVRTLKIDRSFVHELPGDAEDLAITRAVIAMGHSLGVCIVAEGVETMAQRDCLVAMGCDVLQGYLFGHPGKPDEFEALWRKTRPPPAQRSRRLGSDIRRDATPHR